MLQVNSLTKVYGDQILFEEVSFSLTAGERLGLVGRNGCGKSTLFKLILGTEHPDDGTITVPRGYRVGHLAQHLNFTEPNILKEAALGLPEDSRDDEQYKAEIMLGGLGFSEADMEKAPAEFSGGFQIRINLAKLLLSEPNLLLLDEPTNYLDIVSMRWLTSFLRAWRNELILISHDRLFMDGVTTSSMLIHRGAIRKMPGGTEKLYQQVKLDEEIYEKTRVNEEKKRRDLEAFINRFRAQASKATLVQSKIKALERMGKKDELQDVEVLDFRFCEAHFPGKSVLEVNELSFAYPEGPQLIDNLSLVVGKSDRIGIIGKNGKGKSTLLRLFCAELPPSSGKVVLSQNAKIGYFGQTNIARLHNQHTIEQEISSVNPKLERTKIRGICGTMMFSGDDALKKISVLSGGEKSRVLLGKILAEPTNLLILDEPTNHLDMQSIEALIESIKTYDGALIMVTHSELLLRELATRLIVFQGESPHLIEDGYDYFLEKEGWGDETEMSSSGGGKSNQSNNNNNRKQRAPSPGEKAKELNIYERKVSTIENKICKYEAEIKLLEREIAEASQVSNIGKITASSKKLGEVKKQIEIAFEDLEQANSELERKRAELIC